VAADLTYAHDVIKIGSNSCKILSSSFLVILLNSYEIS